jgi:uncharacterized tellurite resistance protein B-like protein
MLANILAAFRAPEPDRLTHEDARLALTALLVRVARADHDYAAAERAMILQLLMERYALSDSDARALRSEAEDLESQAPDTVRFTRVVKEAVPYEHRENVVEALWSVVLADDRRDSDEDGFMRLVVSLLGVSDRDSGLARQRVQSKLPK